MLIEIDQPPLVATSLLSSYLGEIAGNQPAREKRLHHSKKAKRLRGREDRGRRMSKRRESERIEKGVEYGH